MAIIMADAYFESLKRTEECPICGKKFVPAAQHMWKIGGWGNISGERREVVCSYSCMRKWEKEQGVKDKRRQYARREKQL